MGPVEEERRARVDREPAVSAPPDPAAPLVPNLPGPTIRVAAHDPGLERGVWFATSLIVSLIAIRFCMRLLGASGQADFVRFPYGVTAPLVAPFRGVFPESGAGSYILEPESLMAIAIYLLIGWAVVALVRILSAPRTLPIA
jgi:uncharacterized protein YggT (Ycf19 family)